MAKFQIWLECEACNGYGEFVGMREIQEGYGTTARPPSCGECDGKGLTRIKDENFDSAEDLKADYPESFAKNMLTGEWS